MNGADRAMKQELTYRYRLYPSQVQEKEILRIAEVARRYYNEILHEKTSVVLKTGIWKRKLIILEEMEDFAWEHGVDPCVLKYAVSEFDCAFGRFQKIHRTQVDQYKEKAVKRAEENPNSPLTEVDLKGYPEEKSLVAPRKSFTLSPALMLWQDCAVMLPRIGWVKAQFHRLLPQDSRILNCTVLHKSTGKTYLLIKLSVEVEEKGQEEIPDEAIGIVFSPGKLAVRSDDVPVSVRHTDLELDRQIRQAYQTLRRRKPGSNRYDQQRRKLARLYDKQVARRNDALHKAAREIVDTGKTIGVQEPAVKRMAERHKKQDLDEIVKDEAWYSFYRKLQYKTALNGMQLRGISRAHPLWRICSTCHTLQDREQNTRVWLCPNGGTMCSKSGNAARNVQRIVETEIQNWKAIPSPEGTS